MQLLEFYKQHLSQDVLPFWQRAIDHTNGGVYTCFSNSGETLLSKDKFTWSQGRFIWLMAHLGEMCDKGLVNGNSALYKAYAKQTVTFLQKHAFLPNGNCVFLLSETGIWKTTTAGGHYDSSFFADCFIAIGFSEYARIFKDQVVLEDAVTLYQSIQQRLASGQVRSEPYPVPDGHRPHSFSMIMLHVTEQLAKALMVFKDTRSNVVTAECKTYLRDIMDNFYQADGRILEMLTADKGMQETILARHINPGHTIECMWFVIKAAEMLGCQSDIDKALQVIKRTFQLGWDRHDGGLFRFIDQNGGPPQGGISGDAFEKMIVDTWDMKLWWPHSETLYSTLLSYSLSGSNDFLAMYQKAHAYTFHTFPQPNTKIGEWIQVRNRKGLPEEKVVALPVKDPYHIMRNVMLIIELLADNPRLSSEDSMLKYVEVGDRYECE